MIICQCEVVSCRDITAAVNAGARSLSSVCRETGAGKNCGGCIFTIKQVMSQHEANLSTCYPIVEVEGAAS